MHERFYFIVGVKRDFKIMTSILCSCFTEINMKKLFIIFLRHDFINANVKLSHKFEIFIGIFKPLKKMFLQKYLQRCSTSLNKFLRIICEI